MIRIVLVAAVALSLGGCAALTSFSNQLKCESAWGSPPWHPLAVPPDAPCAPYLNR